MPGGSGDTRYALLDDTINLCQVDATMARLVADADDRLLVVDAEQRSLFDEDRDEDLLLPGDNHEASGDSGYAAPADNQADVQSKLITKRDVIAIGLLTVINLLNYIDRYSIAGVYVGIGYLNDTILVIAL